MFAIAVSHAATKTYSLVSPDGKLKVSVYAGDELAYSLRHGDDVILDKSEISMSLTDGTCYGGKQRVIKSTKRSVDNVLSTIIYKKAEVQECFNELTLKFRKFSVIFRAYDSGMAYRFISHSKTPFVVEQETAGFNFPQDWNAWIPYVKRHKGNFESQYGNSFENTYSYIPLSKWDKSRLAFLPLMVDGPSGKKILLTEADVQNYPGMFLCNLQGNSQLTSHFAPYPKKMVQGGHNELQMLVTEREDYLAKMDGACAFPWRIVSVSENDAQMLDNDLVWLLSKPVDKKADFSWVKPGKVAWDWWNNWNIYGVDFESGINNETYKYYIDFASDNGIEYVILDEGWAVNKKADLFQVIPEINLEELVAYASERNVGLILWAGYWAFDRDMEKVCKHYSEMGIKGFKVDFMDRDDQIMTDFHRRTAEMAAKYRLLIDFHGTYKPTGLHREYPNVVNYEGVHGLEQMKWSAPTVNQVEYDVTVPYIRMFAGPMDYTQGATRNATKKNYVPVNTEPMSQGTRCRQLAEYVIFDSPLNMLCDSPSNYIAEPECTKFIAEIPTVWDQSKPLDGEVGDYIVMARRNGRTWYVGALTDWTARDMEIDLSFLGEGDYVLEIFRDGVNAHRVAKDYKKETIDLGNTRKINIHMAPGGGWAAKIVRK